MNLYSLSEIGGTDRGALLAASPAIVFEDMPDAEETMPRRLDLIRQPEEPVRILVVSPDANDHQVLPQILDHPNWEWRHSCGCRPALGRVKRGRFAVVLCERDLPDGTWQDVLEATRGRRNPPSVIVYSRLADESLWAEVLNLGGYDVLMKPFDEEEVLRVTHAAWRSWLRGAVVPMVKSAGSSVGAT